MGDTTPINFNDLDLNLVYIRSPGGYLFELNPGNNLTPSRTLVPLLPWYRLFKGEDLNEMRDALNNLQIRAALAAQQEEVSDAAYTVLLGQYNLLAMVAPLTFTLPACEDFVDGGYVGTPIWIKDAGRNASSVNRITIVPAGADTIEGQVQWQIAQAGGSVALRPRNSTKNRWYVA